MVNLERNGVMLRILLPSCLGFFMAACHPNAGASTQGVVVKLPGTPLTFRSPKGFKEMGENEISVYPPRPEMHFRLPKWDAEHVGNNPQLWIGQLPPAEAYNAKTLDQYMHKRLTPVLLATTLVSPREISVDGGRAIEYGVLSPVFDGPGPEVYYEIDFAHDGVIYQCAMTADPNDYKQYVSIFEDFCSSVHFGK